MLVGIDLGTTNSAVALWKDGAPQLVPNALGRELTPSAVSLAKGGQAFVGQAALAPRGVESANGGAGLRALIGIKQEQVAAAVAGRTVLARAVAAAIAAASAPGVVLACHGKALKACTKTFSPAVNTLHKSFIGTGSGEKQGFAA